MAGAGGNTTDGIAGNKGTVDAKNGIVGNGGIDDCVLVPRHCPAAAPLPPVLADALAAALLAAVMLSPMLADALAALLAAAPRCRLCSQMPLPPHSL
jgi:hypothetical protein